MMYLRLVILGLAAGGAVACALVPARAAKRSDCECCAPPGVALAPFRLAPAAPRSSVTPTQKGSADVG